MESIRPPSGQPRPIRVAFISGLHIGGAERAFLQLAAHFRAAEAVAWIAPYQGEQPLRKEAARLCPVYATGKEERPPETVARAIQETRPDILVAWGSPNLARLTEGCGLPVVDLCQNSAQWRTMPAAKASAAGGAHYLAAVSEGARDAYPAEFRDAVQIIPNGVDLNRVTPRLTRAEARANWQIHEDDRVLAYVARFTPEKNPHALLAAMQHLDQGWRLIVCGPPSETRTDFLARAADLEPGRVMYIETTQPADLLSAADVWTLPSHSEGLPLAMLEAMAAGVPCAVTRWDVIDEMESQFGPMAWTFPRGADGEAIAKAVLDAHNAGRFSDRVRYARGVVFEHYSATRIATLWEQFLASCLVDWLGGALHPHASQVLGGVR